MHHSRIILPEVQRLAAAEQSNEGQDPTTAVDSPQSPVSTPCQTRWHRRWTVASGLASINACRRWATVPARVHSVNGMEQRNAPQPTLFVPWRFSPGSRACANRRVWTKVEDVPKSFQTDLVQVSCVMSSDSEQTSSPVQNGTARMNSNISGDNSLTGLGGGLSMSVNKWRV